MVRRRKSNDPHEQAIQECRKLIAKTLADAKVVDSLEDPQIPEVLVNPHFLVVPKLGSLVTIDIQALPEDRKLWEFTLAKIEDLFEIKMSAGAQTVVSLILFQWVPSEDSEDAIALLRRMFDHVIVVYGNDNFQQNITGFVQQLMNQSVARENLNYLWEIETKARQSNFESIASLSYVKSVLDAHLEFERKPRKPTVPSNQRQIFVNVSRRPPVEDLVLDTFEAESSFWIQRRPHVMNIKQYFINSFTRYYFTFDFAFSPMPIDNGYINLFDQYYLDRLFEHGGGLCMFIEGSKGVFGKIAQLRRLATYARFISYKVQEIQEENILQLRTILPRLFLLIEGNIFGPHYAPDRYLNMLIHAGWRPMRMDDFSKEALLEGTNNA